MAPMGPMGPTDGRTDGRTDGGTMAGIIPWHGEGLLPSKSSWEPNMNLRFAKPVA